MNIPRVSQLSSMQLMARGPAPTLAASGSRLRIDLNLKKCSNAHAFQGSNHVGKAANERMPSGRAVAFEMTADVGNCCVAHPLTEPVARRPSGRRSVPAAQRDRGRRRESPRSPF